MTYLGHLPLPTPACFCPLPVAGFVLPYAWRELMILGGPFPSLLCLEQAQGHSELRDFVSGCGTAVNDLRDFDRAHGSLAIPAFQGA